MAASHSFPPRSTRFGAAWPHKVWASITLALWWSIAAFAYTEQQGGTFLHNYRPHWLKGFPSGASDYPLVARSFAFPILGILEHADVRGWLHLVFWGLALWYPVALLALVWCRADSAALARTLSFGLLPYAAAVILSGLLLAYGLWAPFALL
jgi:hypothetical protein